MHASELLPQKKEKTERETKKNEREEKSSKGKISGREKNRAWSMACSVATMAAGSPVFSPSKICPFSCKGSPETLGIVQEHNCPARSTSSSPPLSGSAAAASSSSSSSSSSPSFLSRFQKEANGMLRVCDASSPTTSSSSSSSTAMKRKRPARIDIPQMESVWEEGEKRGSAARGVDAMEADRTSFSVVCKRGRVRQHMEDRYSAAVNINGDARLALFGIFDGHGGAKAAEFVAKNIEKNVVGELSEMGGEHGDGLVEAVKRGYLSTDSELLREEVKGGTCSVTALIRNEDLIVSNAGDCRAVISRGGTAEALTSDHRPCREDEKNRIECLGGYVDCFRGIWRLQGSLAVSRGMGDAHLKQWVIAEPETTILKMRPECEFLILASDGLWDKVSNQEAVDVARPLCLDSGFPNESPVLSACKALADLSVSRGSLDDVSVMIIQLRHFM